MGGFLLVEVSFNLLFSSKSSLVSVFTILVKLPISHESFSLALLEQGYEFLLVSLEYFDYSSFIMIPITCKLFSMAITSTKFSGNIVVVASFMKWEIMLGKVIMY